MNKPVVQFEIGPHKNFIYLILDWTERKAAIVDPQSELSLPLEELKRAGFELTTILLTHTHRDHTAGVEPLLDRFSSLALRVGERDLYRLSKQAKSAPGLRLLEDGEEFFVGSLRVLAFSTPGHSPGAFMFYLDRQEGIVAPQLFTGDTIFIRDCGRTDFEGGSNDEMFASIQKVRKLPPETVMWVGHHYREESVTNLGTELLESPPFQCRSVDELAALP